MSRATTMSYVAVVTALFLVIAPARNDAQIRVPPRAALDVSVPVPPTPVRIGAQTVLAYELHITNFRPVAVELTGIEVREQTEGHPLAAYEEDALRAGLTRAGVRADGSDLRRIAPSARVVFFVWLPLDVSRATPPALRHRLAVDIEGERGVVDSPTVRVRRDAPIVLGPPLRGGPWAAVYDPGLHGGHRRAIFAVDGRATIPARFAIDWIKLGDEGRPANGDPARFANHYGYGADVLAVADGRVVSAVDRYPEPTNPATIDDAAGNAVTLDVGGGRYVFYEHLRPGSVAVRAGDRVRAGQRIAALGGSGSVSSGPHLHFHVGDANAPLGAEGLPFVLRTFDRLGAFESLDAFARGRPWTPTAGPTVRSLEMPAPQTVVRFPE